MGAGGDRLRSGGPPLQEINHRRRTALKKYIITLTAVESQALRDFIAASKQHLFKLAVIPGGTMDQASQTPHYAATAYI